MANIAYEGAASWAPGVRVQKVAKAKGTTTGETGQASIFDPAPEPATVTPVTPAKPRRTRNLDEYYPLEDAIPVPPSGTGKKYKYPFSTMEVGQSFLIEGRTQKHVTSAVWAFNAKEAKRPGAAVKEFTTRIVEGGIRVWRVK